MPKSTKKVAASKPVRKEVTLPEIPSTVRIGVGGIVGVKVGEVNLPYRGPSAPHLIVEARAGSGKTTTLVESLKILMGQSSSLTPSPQQKAVWDAISLSRGKARSVTFVAFNKSIASELQNRVPQGVTASTLHSLGFSAVRKSFGGVKVNQYRVSDIVCHILNMDPYEVRKTKGDTLRAACDLVGLCKMNLVGIDMPTPDGNNSVEVARMWEDELDYLAGHYSIELNGSRSEVYRLVPQVLEMCARPDVDKAIDFDDMVWLPVALDLAMWKNDLLLVDEAQDLNRCQQALAKKAGERLILCGDPKQAIYGFAGADAESMPRMYEELSETPRGCQMLPLTVTRRCGKAIVREANKIVPDFDAHETNCEGVVRDMGMQPKKPVDGVATYYRDNVIAGDMILCRVSAPLVSECFKFLREGRKANIQGRDVAKGLISTVTKAKVELVPDLVRFLSEWLHAESAKELKKRNPDEGRLIGLQDRFDCLMAFTEGCETVTEVIAKIESVFTDDQKVPGIRLSSVHKAKGLEADRVFILLPRKGGMPHPMAKTAWAKDQEMNLKYVAITRAIRELVWVVDDRPREED